MPPNLTCFTSNASSSILCWNSSSLSLFNSATKCYISRKRLTKNREWAVIKSGKTRLWLEHKNHGDISEAELTEKMKWGDTLCSINFLIFPRITNSLHTRGKKIFIARRSKKNYFCRAMKHQDARDSLLLWIWFFHDISGHIRDFLFPSCQNNLVVYKWVAAFSL